MKHGPTLVADLRLEADQIMVLSAPTVGLWRRGPQSGDLVRAKDSLGAFEILGRILPLLAPEGTEGIVLAGGRPSLTRQPLGYGDELMRLGTHMGIVDRHGGAPLGASEAAVLTTGLVLKATSSGRFYSRPAADRDAFVHPGQVVRHGATIGLLEVMKTFTRIVYGGFGMPDPARVIRVVPSDDEDLEVGRPILEVEPVGPDELKSR